ncbi:dTDP-glucose 4,6-dehydratase [Leptolyngbya sp. 7M]|uniref:dTDP-glucose 4,6-dehydratase n=1 Tax=Leptolyngbya sp. 7M TaxID=2812896 RepID=UPI001B8B5578|nr:dTDP-glucose 4,6-dehydratase [Leptolyngbya sp. 7M]QYO66510.1 dTDP-glucose 4,6-dehydratase [Leptolyngbya sp. 7M]
MRTIFVTGGAGFIGSAFIRYVLAERTDVEIVDLDALTYAGNLENLAELDPVRHRFIKGDICDREAVMAAMPERCDAVFNFAAESHVDRSINSADEFLRTNVIGTQVLLDVARMKGVRRFVQISTDEVMGSLPEDSDEFFTERSELRPNSPYAASKAAAEFVVRAARETHGVDTVITRCGNNYGPRQFPEKLIPLMIANAMNDEPLPVYGDGKNVRDWIYVDDHVRAVCLAYERGRSGEVYNIGARNERQNIDVVTSLLDALGKPHSLIRFVEDRPGHDRRYAIDPTKAETELGWNTRTSWEDGLRKTIDWYRDNQDWVSHIRNGQYRDYYKTMYAARLESAL